MFLQELLVRRKQMAKRKTKVTMRRAGQLDPLLWTLVLILIELEERSFSMSSSLSY